VTYRPYYDTNRPVVSLDQFEGKDYVAMDAPQLLDSILLTPEGARTLAAELVAQANTLDEKAAGPGSSR
jgi:hypothetical protein